MKEETWPGRGQSGGAFEKLPLPARRGTIVICYYFRGGGKCLIHHTFLTPHHLPSPPPPLRDVINDRSLKPFMNWFIGECFTPLSSSLRASEVLRTSHFASDFGCFHVADQETDFVHFLQIETAFSKTNYIRFSYLLIPNCGRDISKNEFLTVAAKCRFCLMFTDICS